MKESKKTVGSICDLLGELLYSKSLSVSSIARNQGFVVTPILKVLKEKGLLDSQLNGNKNKWLVTKH